VGGSKKGGKGKSKKQEETNSREEDIATSIIPVAESAVDARTEGQITTV